jgi:hypothetical protein
MKRPSKSTPDDKYGIDCIIVTCTASVEVRVAKKSSWLAPRIKQALPTKCGWFLFDNLYRQSQPTRLVWRNY